MAVDGTRSTGLDLVARLWGGDNVVENGASSPEVAEHAIITRGDSQLLIPMAPRRARAASVVRWTDDMSALTVFARLGLGAALWTGLAAPLLAGRPGIRIQAPETSQQTLHEYLAGSLGLPEVAIAAAWGPPRPNQKPILRVFDASGTTVAFAKVGWNVLTRELVNNEAAFFASRPRVRTLRVPSLLHHGSWQQNSFSISEPLMGRPPLRRSPVPDAEVLAELAGLSNRYRCQLGASEYRSAILARLGEPVDTEAAKALAVVDDKWSNTELDFGHWHGDWTPWNMRRDVDRLIVWDWERHGPGIPVGFDAIHYGFHSGMSGGKAPQSAFDDAVAAAGRGISRIGVEANTIDTIAVLYALEMQVRFAKSGELPTVPWLKGLLSHAVGRFAGN